MTELLYFTGDPDSDGRVIFPGNMIQQVGDVFTGQTVEAQFKVADRLRTGSMNGFWWGVVIPHFIDGLIDHGYAIPKHSATWKMDLHYWLIRRVFGDESKMSIDKDTGLPYIWWPNATPSSSQLKRVEFLDMIESARLWLLLELNVRIPDIKDAGHRRYR